MYTFVSAKVPTRSLGPCDDDSDGDVDNNGLIIMSVSLTIIATIMIIIKHIVICLSSWLLAHVNNIDEGVVEDISSG